MSFQYNFKDHQADILLLIQAINTIGDNLVGLELGVLRGDSSMAVLHNCSIKKLYLIDNWEPYSDYLKNIPDGKAHHHCNEADSEWNEYATRHRVKYSGMKEKVEIIKEDSLKAVNHIPNASLDFIFFDAMMHEKQSYEEAFAYYPKIKKGGFFMGHDSNAIEQVMKPIESVKEHFNNKNTIHTYLNTFLFKI
jgi:hypothetical protein|tara:strand:- start:767 stop:1345 length:579 start_codon:yes stop_codon:yes gene_type:complete